MFGLIGLLIVLWGLISLVSCWISWDLQHQRNRVSFATKVRSDLVNLFKKGRDLVRNSGLQTGVVASPRVSRTSPRRSSMAVPQSELASSKR